METRHGGAWRTLAPGVGQGEHRGGRRATARGVEALTGFVAFTHHCPVIEVHPGQVIIVDGPNGDQNVALGNFLYVLLHQVTEATHIMLEADGWQEDKARAVSDAGHPVVYVKAGTR